MDLKWDKEAEEIAKANGIFKGTIEKNLYRYFNSTTFKGVDFYLKDNVIFTGKDEE